MMRRVDLTTRQMIGFPGLWMALCLLGPVADADLARPDVSSVSDLGVGAALERPVPGGEASPTARVDSLSADTAAASPWLRARPVDYLWVLRSALLDQTSVDSVVARAREIGVRGLLVQVVGRGDAYYRSDLLPRAEALQGRSPPDFDPLGAIVAGAHGAGLEVHAWLNCLLVWSAPKWPRDPQHVLNLHPEWVAEMKD